MFAPDQTDPREMSCVRCHETISASRSAVAQLAFERHWRRCLQQCRVTSHTAVTQCKSCPWRVGCKPDKDIPNYVRELHRGLDKTIRSGFESMVGPQRVMACHYSRPGLEFACAGWLSNQLGDGNNIGLRIAVANGSSPVPTVSGPQHVRFKDTLPKRRRR